MRSAAVVGILLAWGCGSEWTYEDLDGDGFTSAQGDCWDRVEGPEGSGLTGDQIHPNAVEIWYDGYDSNCANDDDYDADYDLRIPDEFVGLVTFGVPNSGELAGGDCWEMGDKDRDRKLIWLKV